MDNRRPNHFRGVSTRKGKAIFSDPGPPDKLSKVADPKQTRNKEGVGSRSFDESKTCKTSGGDTRSFIISGSKAKKKALNSQSGSEKEKEKETNKTSGGIYINPDRDNDNLSKDYLNKMAEIEGENARLRSERNFWRNKALEKTGKTWDGVVKVSKDNKSGESILLEIKIDNQEVLRRVNR